MTQFSEAFGTAAFGATGERLPLPKPAAEWTAVITLAAVDVSANVTGQISVEAEESTARIATFTLRPTGGSVDVRDWTGATVTIDYEPRGEIVSRLFNGKVLEPVYDPETRLTTFKCTDDLQGLMESKTEAQILALLTNDDVTGKYSEEVFGVRDDGWKQTEDILSTIPAGFDINRDGTTTRLTAWEAEDIPFLIFTDASAKNITLELAQLRDIVNTVDIESDYRFSREHHREHSFYWNYSGLCDWLDRAYDLPTRDMWLQAAGGMDWAVKAWTDEGIQFGGLPKDGDYCNGHGLAVTYEARQTIITSAYWTSVRRWVQSVTEQYRITVQEAGSVAQYGVLIGEDSAGLQVPNDDAIWNASLSTKTPNIQDITGGSGMWVWTDKPDESGRQDLLEALIQIADRQIRQSHRNNFVSWTSWIQPAIERHHTTQLDAASVVARGKVFQYRHVLDIQNGTALTTIKIAVHKCPSGGSQDSIAAPARPDTDDDYITPETTTTLETRIGGQAGAPAYDEQWTGFTSNQFSYTGPALDPDQFYPLRVMVKGPDIEDTAVDNLEVEQTATINTLVPDETLTVTV